VYHYCGGVLYVERRELPLAVALFPGVGLDSGLCFLVFDLLFCLENAHDGLVADVLLLWVYPGVLRGAVFVVWECGGGGGDDVREEDLFESEGGLEEGREGGREGGKDGVWWGLVYLVCGSVGMAGGTMFMRRIYSNLKVD